MRVAVTGAGGAIGGHLVARLIADGYEVRGVDIKPRHAWWQWHADSWNMAGLDCSDPRVAARAVEGAHRVFDLSEVMGGIGFIESHRVACAESVEIGIQLLRAAAEEPLLERFFFSSSACAYSTDLQGETHPAPLRESDAWPARPEVGYGFSKLYMEELCRHYHDERGLETRVARLHNVYGPHSSWNDGREKAPAAICRKIAVAQLTGAKQIEVWGDGEQTRTFCWVADCVDGIIRLTESDVREPLNIGSAELVSVNGLITIVEQLSGVPRLKRVYQPDAAQGVRGRSSDNTLIRDSLGWEPSTRLAVGLDRLYAWIYDQVKASL